MYQPKTGTGAEHEEQGKSVYQLKLTVYVMGLHFECRKSCVSLLDIRWLPSIKDRLCGVDTWDGLWGRCSSMGVGVEAGGAR